MSGADYLQLDEVQQFCVEFLQTNITPDNAFAILKAATLYRNENLKDQVQQYISNNLDEVAKTEDFKTLSEENVISCISNFEQSQIVATSIYKAIVVWTYHDEETRKSEFPLLLKQVKLEKLSLNFLEKSALEEKLVINSHDCQKIALGAFRKLLESQKVQESMLISLGGPNTLDKVTIQ